jgi:hypothetical protein
VWYTALNTVLGPATDRPISQWEESFLPLKLMDHLRHVTIKSPDGRDVPLIKSERTLFTSTRAPEPTKPPTWWPWYLLIGLVIGGVLFLLGRLAPRNKWWRRGFGVAATTYAVILAFCGWFGLWGWFCTSHWAAWRNENLFGYSPAALPLVVAIPMMMRKTPREGAVRIAIAFSSLVAVSTMIGWLLMRTLPQNIDEPMKLVSTINIALWAALLRYGKFLSHAKSKPPGAPPHPQRAP